MVNSVKLKNLYFGHLDGEIESTRDNFEQLFYNKNSKYEQIMNYDRFIISGRKGTGKTLLSKYIHKKLSNEKNTLCKIFTRRDFKLQQLLDMDYRSLQRDEISLFWKWTFLIQIGRSILELDRIYQRIPFTPERKLKRFFSDKYSNDIFKLKEFQTSHKTKNSTGINSKIAKTSLEDSYQTNNTFIKTEYYELINPLEDLIKKCLKRKREFVLIYDDLDELEDKMSEDSNYYPLLFTMLNIIKDINLNLRSIGKKKSKIIVCLRSDIIDDIHKYSSNSNKLTSDNKVDLYWISKNYDNPEDHPLMEMILLKIKHSVPEYSQLDKSSLYKKIFPKRIQNQEVIDYLIDYSYGRPRDIISYLNIIMHNYPEATHFEPKYFTDCSKEYSKWFHNELENEISRAY